MSEKVTKKQDMNQNGVSVVLGSYNRKPFLKRTIQNIRDEVKQLSAPSEIIVIDGGSTDGSLQWLSKQKDVILIIQHNRGTWRGKELERRSWGYFMNLGFKCAQGKYICMVSDDCLIVPGSLKNGYSEFQKFLSQGKRVGALAFYWRNWPEMKRYSVVAVKDQVYLNHGFYLKKAIEDVGYINEDDYMFFYADVDLCLRLVKAGYSVEATDRALVEHCQHVTVGLRKENAGANKEKLKQSEAMLRKNWEDFFIGDESQKIARRIESDIIPDEATARKGFGKVYFRQRLIQALQYRFSRLQRILFHKEAS